MSAVSGVLEQYDDPHDQWRVLNEALSPAEKRRLCADADTDPDAWWSFFNLVMEPARGLALRVGVDVAARRGLTRAVR